MCASLAGARSAPVDHFAHLLLVPDDARADAALAASDARVVASYGEFSLVEAAGTDDQALRSAGADRRDDMREVSLPGGLVDPLRERASLAAKGAPKPDETQAVVQFVGPVKDAWLERLRATGARIVQYVAQNGYLVHARGGEVDRLAGLVGTDPAVRAVTPVRAGDRLGPRLEEARGESERAVSVQTLAGRDGASARAAAAAAGRSLRVPSGVGELRTQFLSLTAAEIDDLATEPAVLSLLAYSEPELLDERASQIVAGNVGAGGGPLNGPGYLTWLNQRGFGSATFGFAIDVTDEGLDTGSVSPAHPDFYENGSLSGPDRVEYAHDFSDDGSARDCGGHGTNVASIAAGYGAGEQDVQGYKSGMGVAPRALIGASKMFDCTGAFSLDTTFTDLTSQAYDGRARISNNSWGIPNTEGFYTADSQEYDRLVRDAQPSIPGNQQMVEVFAAGNEGDDGYGTVSAPGTGKNVITVGASEGVRSIGGSDNCGVGDAGADEADDLLSFSSRGPTYDLRMKPDLVSPGTHLVGAAPQIGAAYNGSGACLSFYPAGSTFYNLISGTSQAAPGVSGAAALLRDWYTRTQGGASPSPALTKAILVNAAADLVGGDNGRGDSIGAAPNTDQGWGRVSIGSALDGTARAYRDQAAPLGGPGQKVVRAYQVQSGDRPVKVTLAFTDAPGSTGPVASVNDLDLIVRQGGRTYKGNVLAGGRSIPGGDADPRNNLESVILPGGASGRMAVEVLATNISGDGVPGNGDPTDQDFALVVSNANDLGPQPVLTTETPVLTDGASGDNDGALEPGETFRLGVPLRNGGNATAGGVTGSVSAAGIAFEQRTSTWPVILEGQTRTNDPEFVGTVSTAVTCGTSLTPRVALSDGDTAELTLPTGEAGPTTTRSSAVPLPIPDNSAAGVVSTIEVASRGIVRDLNVRLNLDHDWVGDLRVELTSPAGTTVRLVDHPGGPYNNSDNFTNTEFDDTAPTNITAGTAPYSGNYKPQNDRLSRFDGEQQRGTWKLRVRDLYGANSGSLKGWQTVTQTAVCDFDTTPPETSISSAPPSPDLSNDPSFSFSSSDSGAVFDCRLDAGAYQPCDSPMRFVDLAAGAHTLEVRAVDGSGNVDPTPASHAWTIVTPPSIVPDVPPSPDSSAPAVSLSRPGAPFTIARPRLSGRAGVAAGDSGSVTVRLWQGSRASGAPAQTFTASRNPSSEAWSATPGRDLADGLWTARAEQSDSAGNLGVSRAVTFRVDATAPEFAIFPLESDLADARAGKLALLAGCGTACRVTAELKAGHGRAGAPVLGRLEARLSKQGSRSFKVKLTRAGRSALRGRRSVNTSMRVKIVAGKRTLSLKRSIVLRRIDLGRVARRGLPLAGACQEECALTAILTMGASEARHHGIRAPGGRPVTVAGGTSRASAAASRLVLKLRSAARKRLLRARTAKVTMESVVKGTFGPSHRTSHRLTLRR